MEIDTENMIETGDNIDSRFGVTPLRRCVELLRTCEEIGLPDSWWLVERAINAYMIALGSRYVDKLVLLQTLKIVWNERSGGRGPIFDYVVQRELDLSP